MKRSSSRRHNRCILAAVLCVISFPDNPAVCDPSDGFFDEVIDFEEILTDIPNRFDLETATKDEIRSLPLFSDRDALRLVEYRESLDMSLQLSESLDVCTWLSPLQRTLLGYLTQQKITSGISMLATTFRSGYLHRPGRETVSEGKYYLRAQTMFRETVSFTLLSERDPGEPRALDFASAAVTYKPVHGRYRLVVGDYRPGYGQGLLFSRYGRSYVNGTDITAPQPGNRENTHFEETRFLRGCHVSLPVAPVKAHLWASLRHLDATLDENGNAVTVRETGYHKSDGDRENLRESLTGIRLFFDQYSNLLFAVNGVVTRYSPSLARRPGERDINDPRGSTYRHFSYDGSLNIGKSSLFFEHVFMNGGSNAIIGGFQAGDDRITCGVLARRYGRDYHAPRSGAFSSFDGISNEKGIYGAVQAALRPGTSCMVSMDIARSLSRRYMEEMPVSRRRINARLDTKMRRKVRCSVSYRSVDDSGGSESRWNGRLRLDKPAGRKKSTGWRIGFAWAESGEDRGPFVEAGGILRREHLRLDMTIAGFAIPSYRSRLYIYERNVAGRGGTGAVWGNGWTAVLVSRYKAISARCIFKDSDLMSSTTEYTVQFDVDF